MAKFVVSYLVLFLFCIFQQSNAASASYNVIKFGAKPDGKTDSTQPFLKAWSAACSSASPSTIYVPKGRYLLKATVFRGPCKNKITVQIDGTLVAPADYRALGNSGYWILFIKVNRVSVFGGTLDAKGAGFWACRKSGQNCPVGARTKALTPTVFTCKHRPELQSRTGSTLQTGDDCISIGPSTRNLLMSSIKCGPGHGISIGSLGKEFNEDGVDNITLTNSIFSGSDNGQSNAASASYNVIKFGAKPDGKTDSTQPFLKAWSAACSSASPSTIYVPKGRYLLKATVFRGAGFWACRKSGQNCPVGARTKALTPTVFTCKHRPELQSRTGSTLQTGDDCISIGPSTRNLLMSSIKCGPGHGISGSDNGVRIKSWARPSNGFVRNVVFQNLIMKNVKNPIIIDQNYCPDNQGCPGQSSGVQISQVTYRNIQGTSATPEAVTFDCSPSNPCRGIKLQDIKLTYTNTAATSSCKNIGGTISGVLMPESCI
ncbi:hypothetical protein D5086_029914 [Populus alba]|uniref:Uncharacterized protein n=1 Tax=Populus alba TaxID=43335 RepID=A0ACC4AM21_POPAL